MVSEFASPKATSPWVKPFSGGRFGGEIAFAKLGGSMKNTITCSKCNKAIEGAPKTESLNVQTPNGGTRLEAFSFHQTCHASFPVGDGLKNALLKLLKSRYPEATIVLEKT